MNNCPGGLWRDGEGWGMDRVGEKKTLLEGGGFASIPPFGLLT